MPCVVSEVETLQTFRDPNVLIVEKLLSMLCFKLVNKNKNKKMRGTEWEKEKIKRTQ